MFLAWIFTVIVMTVFLVGGGIVVHYFTPFIHCLYSWCSYSMIKLKVYKNKTAPSTSHTSVLNAPKTYFNLTKYWMLHLSLCKKVNYPITKWHFLYKKINTFFFNMFLFLISFFSQAKQLANPTLWDPAKKKKTSFSNFKSLLIILISPKEFQNYLNKARWEKKSKKDGNFVVFGPGFFRFRGIGVLFSS